MMTFCFIPEMKAVFPNKSLLSGGCRVVSGGFKYDKLFSILCRKLFNLFSRSHQHFEMSNYDQNTGFV